MVTSNASFPGPPPAEALAYLRAKSNQPLNHWADAWMEEHAEAFMVARATNRQVIATLRGAVERALADGVPFEKFKRELTPVLQDLGWWGTATQVDRETGEEVDVELGSPRRLRTIYESNLRSARAVGQWQRAQRTKDALPFFIYELGPSERHRPEHASWEGLVLPIDDPFFDTHMPPNGWGCKCRVRQVSEREAERRGVSRSPTIERMPWTNPRTGATRLVPKGIDPGWDTNPGKARWSETNDENTPAARARLGLRPHEAVFQDHGKELSAHFVNGGEAQALLRRGEAAHVFNEGLDLVKLAAKVLSQGTAPVPDRATAGNPVHVRLDLTFDEPIGTRLVREGEATLSIPLFTAELKAKRQAWGDWMYHLIPRTKPRRRD